MTIQADRTAGGSPATRRHPAPRLRAMATAAMFALVAAVVTGHAGLMLVAAPSLGALALMSRRRCSREPAVTSALSGSRCFEGESMTLTVTADPGGLDEITMRLEVAPQVTLVAGAAAQAFLGAEDPSARWVLRAGRWGRYSPGTVRVTCRCGMGCWETSLLADLGRLDVFPRPPQVRPRLVPAELLRRIGEHTGRAIGDGVEFAGIRPYAPGDQLRDVNRAVSIRRGQLHVNQRAASRAADLVVMIDAFGETGPPGDSTLDVAVHGAAALAAAYLRVSDRAGVVVLGGMLRWLGPGSGDRQFYRIAEMMLDARYDSYVTPDIGRIPRTALPPGTLVVLFSPLLDERALGAITDLRQRRFPLIVVDTLRHEPATGHRSAAGSLALRLWRLDRAATRSGLGELGVPVLTWDRGTELDSLLATVRRMPPRMAARP